MFGILLLPCCYNGLIGGKMIRLFDREISINTILFVFFTVLFLFFMFTNVDVALMLFISLVFACSLNPIVDKLEKKMPRPVAACIVLFGALSILGILLAFIFMLGAYQISELIKEYPNYVKNLEETIKGSALFKSMGITKLDIDGMTASMANSTEGVIDYIMGLMKSMGSGFAYCLTGLIFLFFFMQDKKSIKATVLKYFPANIKARTEEIIDNISSKMGGYVFAQTMAVLSVFVVNAVGLLILQNPYAISIAIIAAVLDIVPVIGPALAIVICLIGVYEFGMQTLITTLIVMVVAQLVENNLVRPYAFSKLMDLHPTIIFLSLILGGKYFGFIGVLFGPAMAAAICVLLDELYVKNIKEKEKEKEKLLN